MSQEPLHVLVVEDEEAHAELIRRAFEDEEEGYRLTVAGTLAEARKVIDAGCPDLAIVDFILPDGRGLELLMPEDEAEYPVVIMTSHGDEEVAVEAMKAGALQYVVKSASNLAEIPAKVEAALRQWRHIIKRREAEAALQASEEHFRSLIENAQEIIVVLDEDGVIEYISPAVERVLGFTPGERIGARLLDHVHAEDRAVVENVLARLGAAQDVTPFLTYRERHKDGSWRLLEAVGSRQSAMSAPPDDGRRRLVLNARDVTDRREAEETRRRLEIQLRHAQRWELIGQLAGDIANEMSGMLAHILSYATRALKGAPPGSETAVGLEQVLSAAGRSRDMTEQVLMFTMHGELEREPIRLQNLIGETLELLQSQLPSSVEIQRHLDPDCERVVADSSQMHQVLMSLCTNSIYAMRDGGGSLEVRLERFTKSGEAADAFGEESEDERWIRMTVRDTGTGMDAEALERALEPFYTTKPVGQGTGLGLPVAQGIVVSHGGEIRLRSEPGVGTTVEVDLPAARQAAEPAISAVGG